MIQDTVQLLVRKLKQFDVFDHCYSVVLRNVIKILLACLFNHGMYIALMEQHCQHLSGNKNK